MTNHWLLTHSINTPHTEPPQFMNTPHTEPSQRNDYTSHWAPQFINTPHTEPQQFINTPHTEPPQFMNTSHTEPPQHNDYTPHCPFWPDTQIYHFAMRLNWPFCHDTKLTILPWHQTDQFSFALIHNWPFCPNTWLTCLHWYTADPFALIHDDWSSWLDTRLTLSVPNWPGFHWYRTDWIHIKWMFDVQVTETFVWSVV